jgi:nicotinamidase-related amidase
MSQCSSDWVNLHNDSGNNPHSLCGTEGAEVIDELNMQAEDLWLPKPRFSAFFNTMKALNPATPHLSLQASPLSATYLPVVPPPTT